MNQKLQSNTPEFDNRLDIVGFWRVLVKYKILIIVVTILTDLVFFYYAISLPVVYKSEALLSSVNGAKSGNTSMSRIFEKINIADDQGAGIETETALARMHTRDFLINHINTHNLKSIIFSKQWQNDNWIDNEPTDEVAYQTLLGMLTAASFERSKARLSSVILEWENPDDYSRIADITNGLVKAMNLDLKQEKNDFLKRRILYLEREIEKTDKLSTKSILYSMIESSMADLTLLNLTDDIVFKILDKAVVPKHPERRPFLSIVLVGIVVGVILGVLISVIVNDLKYRNNLLK